MKKLAFLVLAWLLASRVSAYVTSATFEYSVDDHARLYLNGRLVSNELGFHYPDYGVLSTSDGTLPLEDFILNGENVLAVEDLDTTGGSIAISYRLTVHHSSGDPVVVWSVPEDSKILHLSKDDPEPQGWYENSFIDSAWAQAQKIVYGNVYYTYPEISDPAFGGIFQGVVPHLSHIGNGAASPGDKNLFRNRFRFPYSPAKTQLFVNPPAAQAGQSVALRMVPGGDVADIGSFKLYADLPAGLDLVSAPGSTIYDKEKRRVGWAYPGAEASVRYVSLPAESVVSASGWIVPQKVLGGIKPDHPTGQAHPNIPDDRYLDAAAFYPGSPAWFKLGQTDSALAQSHPVILGVIFHAQLLAGGQNTSMVKDVDDMMFNYSVDGSTNGVLKKDVLVSRVSNASAWYDGYYDASGDRNWTWTDIQKLQVRYGAQTRRNPDKNLMSSAWAVVKCFRPLDSAPVFYAKVSERGCAKLQIQAGIYSPRFASASSDPLFLPVNQQYCARPTPVPAPVVVAPLPGQTAVPTGFQLKSGKDLGLGCLSSSPEPFNYGGVFVKFCLKQPAKVTLRVYQNGNQLLRQIALGDFRPGDSQIFFNGMDEQGAPLKPGSYSYQIEASDAQAKAQRQENFSRGADRRR